ncbi:MAG: DsbE family thiol:disulfide interchange protein [Pseudomonadota bacterium]
MNPRLVVPIVVFLVLVGFLGVGLTKDPSKVDSPFLGKQAPEFSLPGLRNPNEVVSDDLLKGRVSLVNVWATWCVGCRQEHEMLVDIARSNVVPIIGLNWKDDRGQAIKWLNRLGDPYEKTAFDAEGRVAIDWGVYGAPETFLVDANGVVRHKLIGPMNKDIWETQFLPVINSLKGAIP